MKVFSIHTIACFFLPLLLIKQGHAIPSYQTTTLPMPAYLEESDRQAFVEILSLNFYKDSKDENLYYYVPPMHIRQYAQGAASAFMHVHNTAKFGAAEKKMLEYTSYDSLRLEEYKKAINDNMAKLETAIQKLDEALATDNTQLIKFRQANVDRSQARYDDSQAEYKSALNLLNGGGTLLPLTLARSYFDEILVIFSSMGAGIGYSTNSDIVTIKDAVLRNLDTIANSYGGYMGVNIYGGFTREQANKIIAFRAKYYPELRIKLLPVDKIKIYPLTDNVAFAKAKKEGRANLSGGYQDTASLFKEMQGSGDFLGATITMDITVAGASAFAAHLGPFILPVGIKAEFKQQLIPAEAELDCDFRSGFTVKGRADVRDGLIIFDNDVTNTIKAKDDSGGQCRLNHISGDPKSAEFAAMKTLNAELEKMHVHRTKLSTIEKERYFNGVMNDIQNNRADKRGSRYEVIYRYFTGYTGAIELGVQVIKKAADFYWHTNIQDVENLSTLRFKKSLKIEGHETIDREIPIDFCLVYNNAHKSYDRCTDGELFDAQHLKTAAEEAKKSPECSDAANTIECGKKRDAAGSTANREVITDNNDSEMMGSI